MALSFGHDRALRVHNGRPDARLLTAGRTSDVAINFTSGTDEVHRRKTGPVAEPGMYEIVLAIPGVVFRRPPRSCDLCLCVMERKNEMLWIWLRPLE